MTSHRLLVRAWWEPVAKPTEMPTWWLLLSSVLIGLLLALAIGAVV